MVERCDILGGMRVVFPLLLLFLACAPMSPDERGIVVGPSIHKVLDQDKAMLRLEGIVSDYYNVPVYDLFEETKVWWATTRCPYRDEPAVVYRNKCYHGRMSSCGEMYVAIAESGKTCGTALLHEFGHCLGMELFGDADASHSGDMWDLVATAHGLACIDEKEGDSHFYDPGMTETCEAL